MKTYLLWFLLSLFTLPLSAQDLYFPPADSEVWETTSPDVLGYCSDSLTALHAYLEAEQTDAFLLLKDGRLVLEWYFGDYETTDVHVWASAAKSLRAGLVGVAQAEGYLDIHAPTSTYLGTAWSSLDADKELLITPWHQLTMTTSLNPLEFTCVEPDCLTYIADAGTFWAYHNGPYNLLKNVLEAATGQTINRLTNEWIEAPIGMSSGIWIPAGDNTYYFSRARDMARYGLLIQNGGKWEGTPVITDTAYFNQMISPSQELNPSYGYLWWLNGQESYIPASQLLPEMGMMAPDAPADLVVAAGSEGQFISISREEGLIMIRQGSSDGDDLAALAMHNQIWRRIGALACSPTSTTALSDLHLGVYPNPTTDRIYFTHLPIGLTTLKLTDMQGRSYTLSPSAAGLDLSRFPPGIYQLEAQVDSHRWTARLVRK